MRKHRLKRTAAEHLPALALLLVITLVVTNPAPLHLYDQCIEGDPYLNIWTMDYHLKKLLSDPGDLYNAPIFYPYLGTLAFTDTLFGITPFFALLQLISGSPVAAINLLVLLSFVLSGYCCFLLCRIGLRFSLSASLFVGIAFSFCSVRQMMLGHLHALWHPWLILMPLAVILYMRKRTWIRAGFIAMLLLLQTLSSIYVGFFSFALFAITWVFLAPQPFGKKNVFKKYYIKPLIAIAVVCVVIGAILLQYYLIKQGYGFRHPLRALVTNSATPDSLFAGITNLVPAIGLSIAGDFNAFIRLSGRIGFVLTLAAILGAVFFLVRERGCRNKPLLRASKRITGILALAYAVLAATTASIVLVNPDWSNAVSALNDLLLTFALMPILVGAYLLLRAAGRPLTARFIHCCLASALISASLAIGPLVEVAGKTIGHGLSYYLFLFIPGMDSLRVVLRWLLITVLSLAVVGGYLINLLSKRGRILGAAALILFASPVLLFFAVRWPAKYPEAMEHDKPAYRWLSRQPGDFAIYELPHHDTNSGETEYMMGQLVHGKKLVNGYSAFLVPEIHALIRMRGSFPSPEDIAALRRLPVRFVVVNLDQFKADQIDRFQLLLKKPGSPVKQVKSFQDKIFVAVDKGGEAKALEFIFPRNEEWVSFDIRSEGLIDCKSPYYSLFINGKRKATSPLTNAPVTRRHDISDLTSDSSPTRITLLFHYMLSKPVGLSGKRSIPFDLHVETGGEDENHCVVGINGGLYPRDKGINLYHIGERGLLVEHWNFNTSYSSNESERLSDKLDELSSAEGYLLIVTRFDASRRLSDEGAAAIQAFGIKTDLSDRFKLKHISLIDLEKKRLIVERNSRRRAALALGSFDHQSRLIVTGMQTSKVQSFDNADETQ